MTIYKYDHELKLKELEEITATQNEPKQSKQDEEGEEPVKLDFSSTSINKFFHWQTNWLNEFLGQTHLLEEH